MSTPSTNPIADGLSLNEKLHMLRMADSGIVHQVVANQFNVAPQDINEIDLSVQPFLGVPDFIVFKTKCPKFENLTLSLTSL